MTKNMLSSSISIQCLTGTGQQRVTQIYFLVDRCIQQISWLTDNIVECTPITYGIGALKKTNTHTSNHT